MSPDVDGLCFASYFPLQLTVLAIYGFAGIACLLSRTLTF